MQRKPYAPGVALAAALLATGLTGCTSGSDGDGAQDAKPGDSTASVTAAQPGKYSTLREPCGSVSRGTLSVLLPGLQALEAQERERAYEGQAAITYDTDRRVGCHWKAESPEGTRHLSIDFERVVSYDPAVSDEDRAQELYERKAAAAGISAAPPKASGTSSDGSPSASASASTAGKTVKGGSDKDDNHDDKGGAASHEADDGMSQSPDPSTAPGPLDSLADVAYLNDRLVTGDSGVHRDITVVFRASNVIVTVEYDQWSADQSDLPQSQDLQSKAQRLARELAGRFDE